MPFCDTGEVEVWLNKPGALTEKSAREVVEDDPKFELKKFVVVAQKKKAEGKVKTGKSL